MIRLWVSVVSICLFISGKRSTAADFIVGPPPLLLGHRPPIVAGPPPLYPSLAPPKNGKPPTVSADRLASMKKENSPEPAPVTKVEPKPEEVASQTPTPRSSPVDLPSAKTDSAPELPKASSTAFATDRSASDSNLYTYKDDNGRLLTADSIEEVPKKFRDKSKKLR